MAYERNQKKHFIELIEEIELELEMNHQKYHQEEQNEPTQFYLLQQDESSKFSILKDDQEVISFTDNFTIITRDEKNNKEIDCPMSSSVMTNTLITNDVSKYLAGDQVNITDQQLPVTDINSYFASKQTSSDPFDSANVKKKKRAISIPDIFRKLINGSSKS